MLNRRIVAGLAALTAVASVNLLAACTPSDDNDVFPTPTPGTVPGPQRCQVNWTSQFGDGTVESFTIDAPEDFWKIGDTGIPFATLDTAFTFQDDGFVGVYLFEAHIDHGVVEVPLTLDPEGDPVAFVGTDGTFDLAITANDTKDGAAVGITNLAGTLMLLDTTGTAGPVGSIFTGAFSGTWTPRGSDVVSLDDDGLVTLDVGGQFDLGFDHYGAWAICYEAVAH